MCEGGVALRVENTTLGPPRPAAQTEAASRLTCLPLTQKASNPLRGPRSRFARICRHRPAPLVVPVATREDSSWHLFRTVDVPDVGVVQRGQDLRFTLEAGQALRIAGEQIRKDFERHIPVELRVDRLIHLPHPASADFLDDAIVPESLADHVRMAA